VGASPALDIACESCGATVRVEAHLRTTRCPYCDSPKVVERPPSPDRPDPTFVVPFVLPERDALARVKRWLRRASWFARSGFKEASVRKTRAVYLPAWLYGAVAESDYEASIGEHYQETQTYTSQGKTRTRTVTKTEWYPLAGRRTAYVSDVLVSASKGLPNEELEEVEPFDLRALHRYEPALVSGWIAEEPSLELEACRELARAESLEQVGREIAAFLPGDRQRGLRHATRLQDEVTDLTLLPLWVFAARWADDQPPMRVLVNGQTGEVWGRVPLSWAKITLAVLLGLAIVGGGAALLAWLGR
jgi:DNA-directed RNA polymerase subunit RPC12/RpoP